MKVLDLIEKLKSLTEQNGDLDIQMVTECGCWCSDIEEVYVDKSNYIGDKSLRIVLYSN